MPIGAKTMRPESETMTRVYDLWVVAKPAEDVPGEWVAHCLEFDVVTQGRNARHAFEMASEAVAMVISDDLKASRDPSLRRAPKSFWDELYAMIPRAKAIDPTNRETVLETVKASEVHALFGQMQVAFRAIPENYGEEELNVPALWCSGGAATDAAAFP